MSKLRFNRKLFTLLLANSNFQVSAFRFVIFGVLFSIIYFLIYKFCAKNFKLRLTNSNFHVSAFHASTFQVSVGRFRLSRFCFSDSNFQVSVGKFQFLRFSFSSVYCQIPTFRLLLAIPIFTLLLCKFSASYKLHFQIEITCVISAQLPHNVPALQAVWV